MKKVLWVCNIMLPVIGQTLNLPYSNREGWLSGIFERVRKKEAPFTLAICFPMGDGELAKLEGGQFTVLGSARAAEKEREGRYPVRRFSVQDVVCYAFSEDLSKPEIYDTRIEEDIRLVIEDFAPDLLHIFGTEFPHTLAAVRAFRRPGKTLVGIQGLCGEIAKVYMAGLPEKVQNSVTFRDLVRRDSIRQQQEKFVRRGENEAKAILSCGNITGRTGFDREGTAKINPDARYYFMNETMRQEFYRGSWRLAVCREHSIFLGQGDYPLKGMHFVLEAMAVLLPKYPDIRLYVAGNSILGHSSLKEKLKVCAYGKYLLQLIKKYGLEDKIVLTGKLNAEEMKEQFLNSSVFLCASVLENSPNTIGEAQLLGVPVAASMAGGIPDMIEDGKDGLLFPPGDVEKMAEKIEALWDRTVDEGGFCLAERISEEAAKRAGIRHDGECNYLRLLEIYDAIGEDERT